MIFLGKDDILKQNNNVYKKIFKEELTALKTELVSMCRLTEQMIDGSKKIVFANKSALNIFDSANDAT